MSCDRDEYAVPIRQLCHHDHMTGPEQFIERHLAPLVDDALDDTRVVAIQGPRQAGKSTLAQLVARGRADATVVSLDDAASREAARADPSGFVAGRRGLLVIDEVQRVPELLLAIKASVDRDQRPGRFLITGSARLLSIRAVQDTLAGRIELLELGPLTQGEIGGRREGFIDRLLAGEPDRHFASNLTKRDYLDLAVAGGFPEALRRTGRRRERWFDSYLATVTERESADVAALDSPGQLPVLLALIAARHGSLLNVADVAGDAGMAHRTVDRYLGVLDAIYLTCRLPAWSTNLTSKVSKAPKVFVNDSGLAAHLRGADPEMLAVPELARGGDGPLLEGLAVLELRRQAAWSRSRPSLHHFRDRQGIEVDVILQARGGRVAGIEVKSSQSVRAADFRALTLLRDRLGDRFVAGVVLHPGDQARSFGDRLVSAPLDSLWRW